MRSIAALAAFSIALAATVAPALAREGYVVDNAHLLSANAISTIDQQVGDFHAQTGKEVVVVTEPSLAGQTPQAVAEREFAQQQVNGVMLFIAKSDKVIGVIPDRAARRFFPAGSETQIRNAMRASFNQGNFDEGVINGVGLSLTIYRSHLSSAPGARHAVVTREPATARQNTGFGMGWIWWVIILAVIFFVIRGIFRAMAGPRVGPGGYGAGPGYGGAPGYGPGYGGMGMGMGGGGFWSGLLGGLGGAWLGNELFNRGGQNFGEPGAYAGTVDPGTAADAGGWQNDAGQADMGNASFGGYGGGDAGGDAGGGWGGGGGDFGGGGDSGGGW